MSQAEKAKDQVTLAQFIEANHKLLSTLGIFTALSVFSGNLGLRSLGYILSFLFLSGTILLWFELLMRFPAVSATWRLVWFENVLSFAAIALVGYWLLEFQTIWRAGLIFLVTAVIALLLAALLSGGMKRFSVFNRLFRTAPGSGVTLRNVTYSVFVGVVLLVSYGLSRLLTPYLVRLLDLLRDSLKSLPQ